MPPAESPPYSELSQHPLHLLSTGHHASTAGCLWHLFASFSFPLWVLALEPRDYISLLTHLLTESGLLAPPSLAQFCFSSISQLGIYSDSFLAGCASLHLPAPSTHAVHHPQIIFQRCKFVKALQWISVAF